MFDRLWELVKVFGKLGTISFGGPAAHIALMEDEIVVRRAWLTREHFLDLLGATYLIPGPNALEMAAHVGYVRAGFLGLLVAGLSFTLPAAAITGAIAWAYVAYGSMPQVEPFLKGITPVVLAIILAAVFRLGKTALRSWQLALIGVAVAGAALAGANEIVTLLVGSLVGALLLRWTRREVNSNREKTPGVAGVWASLGLSGGTAASAGLVGTGAVSAAAASVPLWKLALFFLKIGAVLYGSGYVLVAYLQGGLVQDYGWLTERQLIDAVAAGQITPGPLITTATFVGYLVAGWPGAAVATAAIILPGCCFVAIINPWIPRLRRWPWAGRFLDAVNAASVGLTAAVTVTLARGTLIDWRAWLLAILAAGVLWRWKVSAIWLVLAGAIAGAVLW